MNVPAKVSAIAALALSALLLMSCSGSDTKSGSTSDASDDASSESVFVRDEAAAVEKTIVAAEGGSIEVTSAAGEVVRISFPRECLAADTTLIAAPLAENPLDDENVLIPGFVLEDKDTGKGPELTYPAFVSVTVDGELAATTSLVRYNDDGSGYEVVPTIVASRDGKTELVAQVAHFSAYGGMSLPQDEIDKAAENQDLGDFDWVIYVNDTSDVPGGVVPQTIELNLTARNTGGGIIGEYAGSATAVTTNEGDYMGSHISATAESQSTHLDFSVVAALDPHTGLEDDEGDLASLTGDKGPDYVGHGMIGMTSSGSGTISKGGLTAGGTFGNDSSLPLEVFIIGPQVRLALRSPQGVVYWDGYIIGEGK